MTPRILSVLSCAALFLASCKHSRVASGAASQWPPALEAPLKAAGANSPQLLTALRKTKGAEREAMEFLIANMPDSDARTLSANYLLEHVRFSCAAMKSAPWSAQVPKEIFLNDVLPYASLNEPREAWHKKLRDISLPPFEHRPFTRPLIGFPIRAQNELGRPIQPGLLDAGLERRPARVAATFRRRCVQSASCSPC